MTLDDDDMGAVFRAMRDHDALRRRTNLARNAEKLDDSWTVHREDHWSKTLLGDRLDYWPSRNKFRWRGKTMTGDVFGFIRNREAGKK